MHHCSSTAPYNGCLLRPCQHNTSTPQPTGWDPGRPIACALVFANIERPPHITGNRLYTTCNFLLLLVLLVLHSGVRICDARSGKHWRQSRAPSTSLLGRKGKGKSSSSHKQNGKGNRNPYQPTPSTSPNAPDSPSGSPVQGKGHQGPTMPAPTGGNGSYPTLPSSPPPLLQAPPPTLPSPPPATSQETVFNVVDFGANGDGVTDDTQAFEAAWAAACKVEASTVVVPSQHEFVVGPISFSGPYLHAFQQYNVELEKMPQIKPTALRFYGSSNVTVTGITIVNSSQCHLKFDSCQGVMVHNLTISSPGNSPNTDGIHLAFDHG